MHREPTAALNKTLTKTHLRSMFSALSPVWSLFTRILSILQPTSGVQPPVEPFPGEDGQTDAERAAPVHLPAVEATAPPVAPVVVPPPAPATVEAAEEKPVVKIIRTQFSEKQTLGVLKYSGGELYTVELRWDNNKPRASCIPAGTYDVVQRHSEKFQQHFHILDVPNRSYILIHAANYSRQLLGCIAPGLAHQDIDSDGLKDVVSSRDAMKRLLKAYPKGFTLVIS